MKKIISLVIGLALTLSASAQNHSVQSFFAGGISSVTASNVLQVTNLSYASSLGSNVVGLVYTNAGTRVVAAAGDFKNLLRDVTLWTDREGRAWKTNAAEVAFETTASLCIKTIAGSGANAAVTLVFSPVMNDSIGEGTVSTEWFTASITPTASATQVWRVSIPLYKWPGAKKLRLQYINNADTDASSNVQITHLSLNGFIP